MNKRVQEMTCEEFESIPHRKWDEDIGEFRSMVIIPTGEMHDSGYMLMDFVAVGDDEKPIIKLSGCSDVIHIDGIGGFGEWTPPFLPKTIPPKSWSIDCLPCGYLRLFSNGTLTCDHAVSDFSVYGSGEKR